MIQTPDEPQGDSSSIMFLRRLVQAVRARTPRVGRGYKLKETTNGFFYEFEEGNGGIAAVLYRFKSMKSDYLICRSWDGTHEGTADVNIVKPPKLRHSITAETLRGVAIGYSAYSLTNQTRTATQGSNIETQYVTPPYSVNDLLYAIPARTLVSSEGSSPAVISLLDMNIDAREWATF